MDVDSGQYSYEQAEPAMEYGVPFPGVDDVYAFLSDAEGTLDVWEDVYKDASDARKTVVGIVAVGGKRFTINVLDNRPEPPDCATLFYAYVDGIRVNSRILPRPLTSSSGSSTTTRGVVSHSWAGRRASQRLSRSIRQAEDDGRRRQSLPQLARPRKRRIHRRQDVQDRERSHRDSAADFTIEYPSLPLFPEGKEEFVSHQVEFGEQEFVEPYAVHDFDHRDKAHGRPKELSQVVFQYRSEEIFNEQRKFVPKASPNVFAHSRTSYAKSLAASRSPSCVGSSRSPAAAFLPAFDDVQRNLAERNDVVRDLGSVNFSRSVSPKKSRAVSRGSVTLSQADDRQLIEEGASQAPLGRPFEVDVKGKGKTVK